MLCPASLVDISEISCLLCRDFYVSYNVYTHNQVKVAGCGTLSFDSQDDSVGNIILILCCNHESGFWKYLSTHLQRLELSRAVGQPLSGLIVIKYFTLCFILPLYCISAPGYIPGPRIYRKLNFRYCCIPWSSPDR